MVFPEVNFCGVAQFRSWKKRRKKMHKIPRLPEQVLKTLSPIELEIFTLLIKKGEKIERKQS